MLGFADEIAGTADWLGRVLVVGAASAFATGMAALQAQTHRGALESRRVVHSVFSSALDCIISMDGDGRIVDLNAAAERTFGYDREAALGQTLCDLIIPERFREAHRQGLARMRNGQPGRILDRRLELSGLRSDGEEFPVELTVTRADTEPPLFTGFLRDLSERQAAERERERHQRHTSFLSDAGVLLESSLDYEETLAESGRRYDEEDLALSQELAVRCALAIDNARLYEEARLSEELLRDQALKDPLTGLANRTLFLDRLTLALARAGRRSGDPALLFFDLDGFKAVNDEFGHHVGDQVLIAVADRLGGLLRAEDTFSRFGGDEFAVLCEDVNAEDLATVVAGRLVECAATPFELAGHRIQLGISLRVVCSPGGEDTPESLLREADAAMYGAKRAGGGRFQVANRYSGEPVAALKTRTEGWS